VSAACLCGCGAVVGRGSRYRPGHDARHAGQVGRQIASADGDGTHLLAALPSEALRAKASGIAERVAASRARPTALTTSVPATAVQTAPIVNAGGPGGLPPGDSSEQRGAEAIMLAALSERLGAALAPARVHLPDGSWVEIDGVGSDPAVLVEAWAHQGPTKPAQRNKVLSDALKLLHVASQLPVPHRKVLCLSDEEAAQPFLGRSWYAGALRSFGIEVAVVTLGDEWRGRVLRAQARQYR
jgi:hypothetical protein